MPHRMWQHDCCVQSPYTSGSRTCVHCGAPGTFSRWELSSIEGMQRYRDVYGFPPIGPHRKLVDSVLGPLRSRCPRCHGSGILGWENEAEFRSCPVCEGTGGTWDAPEERLWAAYQTVRDEYPDGPSERPLAFAVLSGIAPASRRTPNAAPKPTPAHLRRAFIQAEERLGREWKLKGRGHCRRVSLKSQVSRHVSPVVSCWQFLTPAGSSSSRRLYPLAIVLEAAQRLEVRPADLIEREYR